MTSGIDSLRPYNAVQLIERALRQAGVKAPQFTSEMLYIAQDTFNSMLIEWLNLGIQLWGRDRIILPLYQNFGEVPTPLGTSVMVDLQQRTLFRPEIFMATSDMGGEALFAFDDNFDTGCVQTAPGGMITATFYNPTTITQVGLLTMAAGPITFFLEYSHDLLEWFTVDIITRENVMVGQWIWAEIDGAPSALHYRIRSVSAIPLQVAELFFGNSPSDIPLSPFTYDDWDSLPNKRVPGQPLQWFQDRQLDAPVLFVWPVPDSTARYMTLVGRRRRYLNQVTDWAQALDISPRWYEYATVSMARRLCKELPEADMSRFQMLQSEEARSEMLAFGEERDPAPTRYNPGLDVYQF